MVWLLLLLITLVPSCLCIPSTPLYFEDQLIDHFAASDPTSQKWSQRYYMNDTFFGGPGSPIFVILGGEGQITPETGIYYPYIVELASKFAAVVVEPEHRYYGESLPFGSNSHSLENLRLLTTQQALADTANFIVYIQNKYNCSANHNTRCPVLTIGGSYPGFLSALLRIRYPAVVDFAYSASAPLNIYAQTVDHFLYYQLVTNSAEQAYSGCSNAVRSALLNTIGIAGKSGDRASLIEGLNLCEPLPDYLANADAQTLADEINMIFMYTFANLNMANYPPPNTTLQSACSTVVSLVNNGQPWQALQSILHGYTVSLQGTGSHRMNNILMNLSVEAAREKWSRAQLNGNCYNLSTQLPAGNNATISSGDWTGVGVGLDGENWDYQTCTFNVESIGTNGVSDMFLSRPWSLSWLSSHCFNRFKVTPNPSYLNSLWGFNRLKDIGTTRIVFTNGMKDGWSVGGVTEGIADQEVYVFNLPNGAHHSELGHSSDVTDTDDIVAIHNEFPNILAKWLADLRASTPSSHKM